MLVLGGADRLNRHEIGDFPNAIGREKPGEQEIGLRQIELLLFDPGWVCRGDAEKAAFPRISQRSEDTWRIEAWPTAPVERTILAH